MDNERLLEIIESTLSKLKDDSVVVIVKVIDGRYIFEPHKEDIDQQPNEVWRLYKGWQETLLTNMGYKALINDHEFALLMNELWNIERHKPISYEDIEDVAYFISDNEYKALKREYVEMIGIDYDERCIELLIDEIINSSEYLKILGGR